MTRLNKELVGIIYRHCAAHGILNPIDWFAGFMSLTAKQFKTRFESDHHWSMEEVRRIFQETRDESLIQVVIDFIRREE